MAPEFAMNADAPATVAALLVEGDNIGSAAHEDLPDGLAADLDGEEALDEQTKLARAEERLLDVEPKNVILGGLRSAVPRVAAMETWAAWHGTPAFEPASQEVAEGSLQTPDVSRQATAKVIDCYCNTEQAIDERQTSPIAQV